MKTSLPFDHVIRQATPGDLAYVLHEARLHSNNIGFVPTAAFRDHIDRHNVRILVINNQPAGYTLDGGGDRRSYRLIQVAIDEELWRLGYGSILIRHARLRARGRRFPTMTATIRDGLPMLRVAEATGAIRTATHNRPTARKKATHDYLWQPVIPTAIERIPLDSLRIAEQPRCTVQILPQDHASTSSVLADARPDIGFLHDLLPPGFPRI